MHSLTHHAASEVAQTGTIYTLTMLTTVLISRGPQMHGPFAVLLFSLHRCRFLSDAASTEQCKAVLEFAVVASEDCHTDLLRCENGTAPLTIQTPQ